MNKRNIENLGDGDSSSYCCRLYKTQ